MGASSSANLNVVVISSIIQCSSVDIENFLLKLEGRPLILDEIDLLFDERRLKRQKEEEALNRYKKEFNNDDSRDELEHLNFSLVSSPFAIGINKEVDIFERKIVEAENIDSFDYTMTSETMTLALNDLKFHPSDVDILTSLYCLTDKRGFRVQDVRNVVISFSLLLAKSPRDCMELAFQLFDRTLLHLIDKKDLLRVFSYLNDTLMYFGDKHLTDSQLLDLTDSIFTSAGKIDGEIYFPDFLDLITDHPIVEMLLSPQYQGSTRDKLLDEDALSIAELEVR